MSCQITACCLSNRGRVRSQNEDNLYFNGFLMPLEKMDEGCRLSARLNTKQPVCLAVFDGMGGESCGEKASFAAVSEFRALMEGLDAQTRIPAFFTQAARKMNRTVCALAREERVSVAGTTVTALCLCGEELYVMNLGDSPAYRLQKGRLRKLITEHTDASVLSQCGIVCKKSALTQYLGVPESEMKLQPALVHGRLQAGDRYLICSDGLTDMVPERRIAEILGRSSRTVEEQAALLMEEALSAGGRDNVTIILAYVEG